MTIHIFHSNNAQACFRQDSKEKCRFIFRIDLIGLDIEIVIRDSRNCTLRLLILHKTDTEVPG